MNKILSLFSCQSTLIKHVLAFNLMDVSLLNMVHEKTILRVQKKIGERNVHKISSLEKLVFSIFGKFLFLFFDKNGEENDQTFIIS